MVRFLAVLAVIVLVGCGTNLQQPDTADNEPATQAPPDMQGTSIEDLAGGLDVGGEDPGSGGPPPEMGTTFPFMYAEEEHLFNLMFVDWREQVSAWRRDEIDWQRQDCAARGMGNSGTCNALICDIRWQACQYLVDGYKAIFWKVVYYCGIPLIQADIDLFNQVHAQREAQWVRQVEHEGC